MATQLRLLLIEDSEDDAELIAHELRRGGYEPTCTRVDTAPALTQALTGGAWDLITCDWVMPRFSGSNALEIVRAHDVDVPTIVVSGEVGEEFAVTAMKAGADDLVSKHRLGRLLPAVEHGLREAEERRARRRAEEAFRQSEERFRSLTENASDLVAILRIDGTICYASPSHEHVLGYRPEELVGKNTFTLVHADDIAVVTAAAAHAAEHLDGAQSFEWRARHQDGSWRYIESIVKAVQEPQGLVGIINSRDITDRKHAEAALRESEERHRSLFEDANDMIYTHDLEGRYTWVNAAAERLIGYTRAELLRMDITQLVLPNSLMMAEGYTPGRYGMNILTKDGREVRTEVAAQLVLRDGQPVGWQGIVRDVTERMRMEEALRHSEEYFRSLIENALDLITVVDRNAIIQYASPSHERALGYQPQELIGTSAFTLVHPEDYAAVVETFGRGVEDASLAQSFKWRARHKDGSWRHLETIGRPVGDEPTVAILNSRDVTERTRFEAELARTKDAAEAATRAKSDFLARMSHEIRTPMNGVTGMLDLLGDTPLTGEQREYLEAARDSGALLLSVINDILDFSKIEAGKLDIERVDFDVRQCLASALRTLAAPARDRGLQLTWHVAPEVPGHLRGDPGRLQQILINLVGNAIKFTDRGEVVVEVGMADGRWPMADSESLLAGQEREVHKPSAICHLRFSVRDPGMGIPPDKQAAIFEAFEQADGSTTRQYGGTGLGLTICKRLVEMMGGRIWVESEPGHGSTFHFTVRLAMAAQVPDAARAASVCKPTSAPVRSLRILVAEDNIVNQKVVVRMLEKRGHVVLVVNNGKDAVTTVQRCPVDVVIMDVQMPEMDGLQATAEIRHHERAQQVNATSDQLPVIDQAALVTPHIPIIAVTAHAMKGDSERCLAAGMDGYVSKPIQPAELFAAIEAVTTLFT